MKHQKYIKETYPITIDFERRIRTGQTPQSATVTAYDEEGVDVTSSIIKASSVGVSGTKVVMTFKANGGSSGVTYNLQVIMLTENDTLEQLMILDVV